MNAQETFASAFIDAALFADTPDDYQGNGKRIGLATESANAMRAFASAFYESNQDHVDAYPDGITQAGHDLWFTTAGHGCGYWEQRDEASVALDQACRIALPYNGGLYEGDDGLLYWEARP